jgi:hypothetical protein
VLRDEPLDARLGIECSVQPKNVHVLHKIAFAALFSEWYGRTPPM